MAPNRFGSIRELPSGRFQARYRPLNGEHVTAPETFETLEEAQAWLDTIKATLESK